MSNAIKVLYIAYRLDRGGAESRIMDIIRHIDSDRVQIDVYTYSLTKGEYDDEFAAYGGSIYYNKPLTIQNCISYIFVFKEFLLKHPEYRIIHANQNAWCSVFCWGAKLAGVPVRIAHSRTSASIVSFKDFVRNIIKIPTKYVSTDYFSVSDKAAIWLFGKKNYKSGRVKVWPNAIECRKYKYDEVNRQNLRKQLGIENKLMILHVGNFTLPKNHTFLIDVFCQIKKVDHTAILCLVGGGDDSQIRGKAERLGLTKDVIFAGARSDVPSFLSAADVFVFPSLYEGFPGAVLEAQVAGLQCIISDSITHDVCILDSVTQLPLRIGAKAWAAYIVNKCHERVDDAFDRIVCTDYEIINLVEQLTEFYEDADKRCGVILQ